MEGMKEKFDSARTGQFILSTIRGLSDIPACQDDVNSP